MFEECFDILHRWFDVVLDVPVAVCRQLPWLNRKPKKLDEQELAKLHSAGLLSISRLLRDVGQGDLKAATSELQTMTAELNTARLNEALQLMTSDDREGPLRLVAGRSGLEWVVPAEQMWTVHTAVAGGAGGSPAPPTPKPEEPAPQESQLEPPVRSLLRRKK